MQWFKNTLLILKIGGMQMALLFVMFKKKVGWSILNYSQCISGTSRVFSTVSFLMRSTLKWTELTSLYHSSEPSKLFFLSLFFFFFLNKENLLWKLDLRGLAALSGLVSCDHQQVCHIILFMNSSTAILNHLLPLIGLSISSTLVSMIKDVF